MAGGHVKGLYVEIGANSTPLKKALRDIKSEATVLRTHLADLSKTIQLNPSSTDLVTQKQRVLGRAIAQNTDAASLMRRTYERYAGRLSSLTDAELTEFRNLERQMARNSLQYQQLKDDAIRSGAASSASFVTASNTMGAFSRSMRGAANAAAAVSAGVAIAGGVAVRAAVDFEQAFAGVRKTIVATEAEYDVLAKDVRRMALEKPVAAEDIAYIMELAGQLNVAKENLSKFAGVIADLDVATNLDLEDASLQLAKFMNITNTSQYDIDRLGATIVDLGNNSATTERDIMNMAMRIAGSASNIGFAVTDVLALATSLSSVGIQAEMGGNAISTIMNRIDKDVANSSETLGVWAETAGMTASEFAAKWGSDVRGAFLDVVRGMGEYRDEGGNLNLLLKEMDIGYMRQVDTMQRVSRSADMMESLFNRASAAFRDNSALTREVSQRYDTAASKIQMMRNAAHEAAISFGEEILPEFKDVVVAATGAVTAFGNMDSQTKQLAIQLGVAAVAGGLLLKAVQATAGGVSKAMAVVASAKTAMAFYSVEHVAATASVGTHAGALAALDAIEGKNIGTLGFFSVAQTAAAVAAGNLTAALGGLIAAAGGVGAAIGIVAGVGAAVAALGIMAVKAAEAADGTRQLTDASQRQHDAMEEARARYEAVAAAQGETSDAALKARSALERETEAFEAAEESVGEMIQRLDDAASAHEGVMDDIANATDEANVSAGGILAIADRIGKASSTMEAGAEKTAVMEACVTSLNDAIPELNASYDALNDTMSLTSREIHDVAEAEADRLRADAAQGNFAKAMEEEANAAANLAEVQEQLEAMRGNWADYHHTKGQYGEEMLVTSRAYDELIEREAYWQEQVSESKRKGQEQLDTLSAIRNEAAAMGYAVEAVASGQMGAAKAASYFGSMLGTTLDPMEVARNAVSQLSQAEAEAAQETQEMREDLEGLMASAPAFAEWVQQGGYDLDTLSNAMIDAGIDADDMAKQMQDAADVSADALAKIADTAITKKNEAGDEVKVGLDEQIENLRANYENQARFNDAISALYENSSNDIERACVSGYLATLPMANLEMLEELVSDDTGKFQEIVDLWSGMGDEQQEAVQNRNRSMLESAYSFTEELQSAEGDAAERAAAIYDSAMEDVGLAGQTGAEAISQNMRTLFGQLPDIALETGEGMGSGMAEGMGGSSDEVLSAGVRLGAQAVRPLYPKLPNEARTIGTYFTYGLANGIGDSGAIERVKQAASSAVEAAIAAANEAQESASPSRVMKRVGGWFSQGYAIGISDNAHRAAEQARAMARSAERAASAVAMGRQPQGAAAGAPRQPHGGGTANYYSIGDVTIDASKLSDVRSMEALFGKLRRAGAGG